MRMISGNFDAESGRPMVECVIGESDLLSMAAHKVRLKILRKLYAGGPMTVRDLTGLCQERDRAIRAQLEKLVRYCLVKRDENKPALYRLNEGILEIAFMAELLVKND
jgi:predicted transcriptional regulator